MESKRGNGRAKNINRIIRCLRRSVKSAGKYLGHASVSSTNGMRVGCRKPTDRSIHAFVTVLYSYAERLECRSIVPGFRLDAHTDQEMIHAEEKLRTMILERL